MKTRALLNLCAALLGACLCLQCVGQQYSINWYKIAGGGGTSTGGVHFINSTNKFIIVSPPAGNRFYRLCQ